MKHDNDFPHYVAAVFKDRLKKLGISQYKFLNTYADLAGRPTLTRIMHAHGGTNIKTLAHYADLLGLEIVIRPKTEKTPAYNEDKD